MAASFFAMSGLLLLLDVLWVTLQSQKFGLYFNRMHGVLAKNKFAISILWILVAIVETSLLWYVLHKPDMQRGDSLQKAAQFGALAGFVIYFVFNVTSLITTQSWSVPTAIGDICWGTVLMTSVAVLGAHVIRSTRPQKVFDPAVTNPATL
jgi:uncharacterized membrane protein